MAVLTNCSITMAGDEFRIALDLRGPGQRTRYGDSLRDGRSGDRIPVRRGEIFRTRPDRGPRAHPASCTMGTRGLNGRGVGLTTHPHLA
jgi:hypothetical protein